MVSRLTYVKVGAIAHAHDVVWSQGAEMPAGRAVYIRMWSYDEQRRSCRQLMSQCVKNRRDGCNINSGWRYERSLIYIYISLAPSETLAFLAMNT